jgi:hypothetical protein
MKATIVRPDGTRIEAEGTPEEIARLAPAPVPWWPLLCTCLTSSWCPVHGQRWWTPIPTITYGGNINAAGGNALPVIYGTVQVAAHVELS